MTPERRRIASRLPDKTPWAPGKKGLQDQRIMEALSESARTGRAVCLPRFGKPDFFCGSESE